MKKPQIFTLLNKSSGFTLLELTIVFTIIAALGSVGFAAFSNFSSQQVLDQAAQDLKLGIDKAKFSAISRVKPTACASANLLTTYIVVICATDGVTACASANNLYEIRPVCTPVPNPSPIPSTKEKSTKITVSVSACGGGTLPANNNSILFSPLKGVVRNTGCTIVLTNTDNGNTKTICVDAGGNASIKSSCL